jgi:hypothetical protein
LGDQSHVFSHHHFLIILLISSQPRPEFLRDLLHVETIRIHWYIQYEKPKLPEAQKWYVFGPWLFCELLLVFVCVACVLYTHYLQP